MYACISYNYATHASLAILHKGYKKIKKTILVYVAKTINCTWTLQSYFKASFTVDTYGLQYG